MCVCVFFLPEFERKRKRAFFPRTKARPARGPHNNLFSTIFTPLATTIICLCGSPDSLHGAPQPRPREGKSKGWGPGPKAYRPWIKDLVRDLGVNLLPAVEDDQHSPPHPCPRNPTAYNPRTWHDRPDGRWRFPARSPRRVRERSGNGGDACGIDGEEHSGGDPTFEVHY